MIKVRAYVIDIIGESINWSLRGEAPFIYGTKGHFVHFNDEELVGQKGDWCIVWPNGLVTCRTDANFKRDFTPLGSDVYETPWIPLFYKTR